MAKYRYAGPGPHVSDEGQITRPGDEREEAELPDWGPWDLIDEPETDEGGQPPSPPKASPAALSAAPALNITPAPPATAEGM